MSTQTISADAVRFVRLLPGPIERVWSFLADSEMRARWLGAGALPGRTGEHFRLEIRHSAYWPDATADELQAMEKAAHAMTHVLVALEPPYRLAYTFQPLGWEETLVDFRLVPEGEQVRLILTHSRMARPEHARDAAHGWRGHLNILRHLLEGTPLPRFSEAWV